MRQAKAFIIDAVPLLYVTGALAKWAAALNTLDGIKHNFRGASREGSQQDSPG